MVILYNDTYGHAEGDRALVTVANSLKKVLNRHNRPSFLARYGGDEFILIVHMESTEHPDQLIRMIREQLRQECVETGVPYMIFISAGFDLLRGGQDTVQACIQRADEKLYQDKRVRRLRESRAAAR